MSTEATEIPREERLLIGGKLVEASNGATYENLNPATEEVLGVASDASDDDIDAAVAAARAAFDETRWSTDHALRVRCLRQLQDALRRNADDLRATIVAEVGSPVALTYSAQLDTPVEGLGFAADLAEGYPWRQELGVASAFGAEAQRYVLHEAAGVVAAIVPWNFPMQIQLAKVGPALAAGCTVVLKGAPATPWTALLLGRIAAEETDLPPGVLNVLTSSRNEAGQRLVEDPRVDVVSFTGSTATGRAIMAAAAPTLKRLFLELGGKSALIALDDADLELAAMLAAFNITTHAGQGCAITSRVLLPRSRFDEGVEAIRSAIAGIPYGDPTDPANLMGPLISEAQRDRVLGYIRSAVDDGGTIVTGGGIPANLPKGWFVEPTVLTGLGRDAKAVREEIFGPVLCILAHDGDDEAVALANDSMYGLSGGVVSTDLERARAVTRRLRTGTVGINGGQWYAPDVPFGGYKQSGIGRESGVAGFEEYLEIKSVAEPR
ncbi:MAG: aldehyde dehydrogenase [Acidimicrobiaceae bacterium]